MKILVLGASGMLGNAVIRVLVNDKKFEVFASARSPSVCMHFPPKIAKNIITGVDVENFDVLSRLFSEVQPNIVINCIGLVKQLATSNNPLSALPINAMLPHRIAQFCQLIGARLIHISTDCVFSGRKGRYVESDEPDALDLYGRSKLLGEVDYPHAVTLRTSIIGRELNSAHGLIGWFLAQKNQIKGYTKAIFSGLPTCELARVIRDEVMPRHNMRGLYHVAAAPISKYELLQLVNKEYQKELKIEPDNSLVIDRSLNADRFKKITGYVAPPWPVLVAEMRKFR
ncbi:MAG: NAD(P)-dependent oxidoreductase [Thalassospira sp.]|uniref:dTDP-4-dehydrorhamnose reductase family protein n=1 Tax=Thalassospira sp. TaxID=1912094 RepID=UPI000C6259E8|nr:SDR family oxidoreductase [Thalassospira sp.]MAZ35621.1 NAD(P)-dependent oxidoreductase [Thalassospira sp.]|tara:strand:- start:1951 stop:2805 length:855 start_codon:yes stop_codon:yes gene_type:complete